MEIVLEGIDSSIQGVERSMMAIQTSTGRVVLAIGMNARDLIRSTLGGGRDATIAQYTNLRKPAPDMVEVYVEGEGAERLKWAINGTPPHDIVARRGAALRFPWGGGIHFYRRVRHPGTQPRDVLGQVMNTIRSMAENEVHSIQI